MNTTKNERKEVALTYLKKLDIYAPYIAGFKKHNDVCYFERFGGFWAFQNPDLINKMHEIEEKHNATCYAITHEYTEFGELYDFLLVTDYKEEWDSLLEKVNNTFYAFAYVWNRDDEYCSEFGSVVLQSFGGGIRRIA